MPKIILIDYDGVCINWTDAVLKLLGITNPPIEVRKALINADLDDIYPKLEIHKLVDEAGSDFWRDLEVLPWAKDLVKLCQNEVLDVAFFTSMGKWKHAPKGKMESVEKHFPYIPIILGRKKHYAASQNTFLIDDKPKNIHDFKRYGGSAYLWPNEQAFFTNQTTPKIEFIKLWSCLKLWKFKS